jgi:hypothetical protein
MQVKAEGIEAELGNNGITLRVKSNDGKHVGRLQVGKAKLRWYKGKTSVNHKDVSWDAFLEWLESK